MPSTRPTAATSDTYQALTGAGTVLVDFHADWCGPCRMLAPHIAAFAADRPDVPVVTVDVDTCPDLAQAARVLSVPTLLVLHDGTEAARHVGAIGPDGLADLVDRARRR